MKLTTAICCTVSLFLASQPGDTPAAEQDRQGGPRGIFRTDIPAYPGNVILGRPTDRSITLSVMMSNATGIVIMYGVAGGPLDHKTSPIDLKAGEPREIQLNELEANMSYDYRLLEAATGKPLLQGGGNGTFQTSRMPGSSFSFTVSADSHLDENSDPSIYITTLRDMLAERPDFHIDLGDTFMTGKHKNRESAAKQYAAQRYYLGLIGASAPLFLVIGNHDGEETFRPESTGADGLATWSCTQRKRYFPNPVPGTYYSGNSAEDPAAGLLQDYYAWTWGDALFIVLDPYRTSGGTRGGKDPWGMTLGTAQYNWLAATLRSSKAKYKFVFIHQLVGGLDRAGRGGVEAAPLYEWGGHEADGRDTFASHRPGWGQPIHKLLVETGVTAVFHGHDHFFARQELDGIVYQLVPQPGFRGDDRIRDVDNYGYKHGSFIGNPGYLRVRVSPGNLVIEYIMTSPERVVADRYVLDATPGR